MTTTTNPGNYVDFDEYVGLKLEKTRSTIRTTDLLTAVAGVAAMFLGYLLIFVVLDQWVVRDGFGVGWRWTLLSTLMLSTIGWLVWKVGIPSFSTVNGLFAAREIERAEPGLKSNLLNLIDLKGSGRAINPAILKAMERQAAVRLQQVDVTQAIDHRPLVRTAYVLLAVIVLFCLYALFSPKKISNSIWRGLFPAANVPLATSTEILSVKPGHVTVPAHTQSVEVQVDLSGEIPEQIWLLYTTEDGKFNRQPVEMRADSEGQTRFKGQLIGESAQGLMQDLTYFIRAGDAESPTFKITVEQPPSAEIESVRIEFPGYMKLEPIEQLHNGQIDAWEGAKIVVNAKTNMPVRSGLVQFMDDPQFGPTGEEAAAALTAGGRQLQAQWTLTLRSDGTFPKYYRIDCRTEDGRRDTAPTNHGLTIRPDLPPEVMLLQPERDLDAPANATIPLLIQARDPDFELGYIYLNAEKGGQKILHEQLSEGRQSKLTLKHELALAKLNAATGDMIEFWIEAYDNKQPRPNTKNTPKIKIRVLEPVSPKEAERQTAEKNDHREQKLAEAERETNPDQDDMAPQSDDNPQERQPLNETRPNETDPKQRDNSHDDQPQDRQNGQPPQNKQTEHQKQRQATEPQNGTGQSKDGQKKQKTSSDDKNPQDAPGKDNPNGASKSGKPLNPDGSQDDEAIRRLNEKLGKNSKNSDENPNHPRDERPPQESGPPQPKTDESISKKQSPDDDAPSEKTLGNTNEKKQTSGGGKQDPEVSEKDSSERNPSIKDDPEKPNPSITKPEPTDKPAGEGTKPDRTAEDPEKKSAPQNPSSDKKDGMPTEGTDPTKPKDKSSGKPDQANLDQNAAKPERATPDNPQDDPQKKKVEDRPDPALNERQPGTAPEQQPGKNDPQQADSGQPTDEKSKSPSEKMNQDDAPAGLNERSPKQKASTQDNKSKQKSPTTETDKSPQGPEERVPDSADAEKRPANGTEQGTAKPDRDPNRKPGRAKNDNVKRDPSESPEIRESQSPSEAGPKKPPNESSRRKPGSAAQKPGPEKQDDQQTDPSDSQKSTGPKSKANDDGKDKDIAKSNSQAPEDSKPGDNAGGKTEPNSEQPAADGTPSETRPENKNDADKKTSDSNPKSDPAGGEKKSGGEKSGDKKSDQGGKSDKSESGAGKGKGKGNGDKPGKGGSSNKPSDAPGSSAKPGEQSSNPNGLGGSSENADGTATHGGESTAAERSDEANLEYNRQATELILQKLTKELERGDVDPELLEQLGWTQAEMKLFADRLSKYLDESKRVEETPEAKARQAQFQEMLKSLDLQKSGAQRSGEKEPKRDVSQVESKRTPAPPAYRSVFEKFTRDLNRQKSSSGKKSEK